MRIPLVVVMLATVLVAACGVVRDPEPGTPGDGMPAIYRGMLSELAPVTFGGGQFCTYTIALHQIDIQIMVQPSGRVTDAEAQNLNIETAVPPCPFDSLDPSIATYTFASATTTSEGILVILDPAPTNIPIGALTLRLERSGDAYLASFRYHRTDQAPPLDWAVSGSLVLSLQ